MSLITSTSPHATVKNNTGAFMRQVIYATLPGLAVLTWQFLSLMHISEPTRPRSIASAVVGV